MSKSFSNLGAALEESYFEFRVALTWSKTDASNQNTTSTQKMTPVQATRMRGNPSSRLARTLFESTRQTQRRSPGKRGIHLNPPRIHPIWKSRAQAPPAPPSPGPRPGFPAYPWEKLAKSQWGCGRNTKALWLGRVSEMGDGGWGDGPKRTSRGRAPVRPRTGNHNESRGPTIAPKITYQGKLT